MKKVMVRVAFEPFPIYFWYTMRSIRSILLPFAMLFSMAMVLVSCSKECVEPSTAQETEGSGKRGGDPNSGDGGQQGGQDPSTQDPKRSDDGTTISDDGDDLSDNERNRKKKVN